MKNILKSLKTSEIDFNSSIKTMFPGYSVFHRIQEK